MKESSELNESPYYLNDVKSVNVKAKLNDWRYEMRKIFQIVTFVCSVFGMSGCSRSEEFVTWQEDVQLNDGRVLKVTQKKRCESGYTGQNWASCIVREGWLNFSLPEFSKQEITWHGNLDVMIINVYQNHLYMVGQPMHLSDYRAYGEPEPPYIGFMWNGKDWSQIEFKMIPIEIYDTNMLIENVPPPDMRFISLSEKNGPKLNGQTNYRKHQRRIDPNYKSKFPKTSHTDN